MHETKPSCYCIVLCCDHSCWLCGPMDFSSPGSSVHGILQARILEWVAISNSRGSSPPRDRTHPSCIFCTGRQILYHWATWEALKPSHFFRKVKGLFLVTVSTPQKLSEVSSHVGHYSVPSCHFLSLLISPLNTWKCWFLTSSSIVWDFPRAFFSIPGWLLPHLFPGVIMGVVHEGIWGLRE